MKLVSSDIGDSINYFRKGIIDDIYSKVNKRILEDIYYKLEDLIYREIEFRKIVRRNIFENLR